MGHSKKTLRHFSIQLRSMRKLYHFALYGVVMGNKINAMTNYGIEEDEIAISNQPDYILLLLYHVQRGRLILEFFLILI